MSIKVVHTIAEVKETVAKWRKKGETVGYDGEYLCKEDIRVAVVPIGYSDGLYKNFSGKNVIINSKKYQIIGAICMGMTMIKVDKDVSVGDEVIFIGGDLTPKKVARSVGLTTTELLSSFDSNIKRIYK